MTSRLCSRAWQAEAAYDGRLSAGDRASFERHTSRCSVCSAEMRALGALREAASRLPAVHLSPLEHRRQRVALLRSANELGRRECWRLPRRPLLGALALAVAGALWFVARTPEHARAVASPAYELKASAEAKWRSLERTSTVRLALERGGFAVAVHKLRQPQRFLLQLPDGELEVKGTRFFVEVDAVRTRAVTVWEGRVALRLDGEPPLVLGPGDRWPPAQAAVSPAPPAISGSAPPPGARPAVPAAAVPAAAATTPAAKAASGAPAAPLASSRSGRLESPGRAFADAMKAFSAGDYGRAERLFLQFESQHAGDTRVEDAVFLRSVARARRGDDAGARAVARDYLRRFPRGLRRIEAERMAR